MIDFLLGPGLITLGCVLFLIVMKKVIQKKKAKDTHSLETKTHLMISEMKEKFLEDLKVLTPEVDIEGETIRVRLVSEHGDISHTKEKQFNLAESLSLFFCKEYLSYTVLEQYREYSSQLEEIYNAIETVEGHPVDDAVDWILNESESQEDDTRKEGILLYGDNINDISILETEDKGFEVIVKDGTTVYCGTSNKQVECVIRDEIAQAQVYGNKICSILEVPEVEVELSNEGDPDDQVREISPQVIQGVDLRLFSDKESTLGQSKLKVEKNEYAKKVVRDVLGLESPSIFDAFAQMSLEDLMHIHKCMGKKDTSKDAKPDSNELNNKYVRDIVHDLIAPGLSYGPDGEVVSEDGSVLISNYPRPKSDQVNDFKPIVKKKSTPKEDESPVTEIDLSECRFNPKIKYLNEEGELVEGFLSDVKKKD